MHQCINASTYQCINGRGVAMPAGIPAVMHPKYFNIQDIVMKHITGEPGAVRTLSSAVLPILLFRACHSVPVIFFFWTCRLYFFILTSLFYRIVDR